jgi:hypothetical protein
MASLLHTLLHGRANVSAANEHEQAGFRGQVADASRNARFGERPTIASLPTVHPELAFLRGDGEGHRTVRVRPPPGPVPEHRSSATPAQNSPSGCSAPRARRRLPRPPAQAPRRGPRSAGQAAPVREQKLQEPPSRLTGTGQAASPGPADRQIRRFDAPPDTPRYAGSVRTQRGTVPLPRAAHRKVRP